MPWNSRRFTVDEDETRKDNRILAYRTPKGKLAIVVTNRLNVPFTFNINTGVSKTFKGYRYTPSSRNMLVGSKKGTTINPVLPPLTIEFWVEQ